MPRHYKAKTDHTPIDYNRDLNSVVRYFRGSGDKFLSIFHRWKLRIPERDDIGALIEQVTRRLIDFALACGALPMTTPRKLIATVKEIAKRPGKFLADPQGYDPEAVARVYEAFARGSEENLPILSRFEVGLGSPPPEEEIAKAASGVLDELTRQIEENSQVGGQTLVLQRDLIQDLADIFLRFGGSRKRSTQFNNDLPEQYSYHGPFHDFLQLVLIPARPFARKAGFKMASIRSLVTIPQDPRGSVKEQPSLFGATEDWPTERGPARRGNFFKLHERRQKTKASSLC